MAGGMLGRRIRHGWLLLALITTAGHADTLEQDAQRFGRLPTIGDARLSPDGTQLLTLIAFEGAYQVGIRDLVTGASKILLSTDGVEFRYQWCEFASATRVVCSLRKADELVAGSGSPYLGYRERRTIREHLIAVDIDGENVLQLVPRARTRTGGDVVWNAIDQDNIIAWLPSEPDHVLIQIAREDRLWPSVYRLDIRRNRLERVLGFRADVSAWRATPNGEVRLGFGVRNGEPFAARVNGRSLEEIDLRSAGLGGIPSAIALEADGPAWVIARGDAEHGGLMAFDLESAQRIGTPVRVENEEVLSVRVDRRSGAPIAITIADPKPRTLALEDELAETLDALAKALPDRSITLVDRDAHRQRHLLRVDAQGRAPELWFYDRSAERLARIAPHYPELEAVSPTTPWSYRARDGLRIPGWLTRPDSSGPGPTILLPHGGPWAHDTGRFDYLAKFLAARGYVVLQPNYRGSTGEGRTLEAAGKHGWGTSMQDDLFDGLDALVEAGIADPERVCVLGESYGGYAALLAAFRDAERIRCAASYAGVSDLEALNRYWRSFVGTASSLARLPSPAARTALSPIENADAVSVPVLVMHGAEDRVVTVEHSRRLAEALKRAESDVRYVEQAFGDHHLSRAADRIEFLTEIGTFLDRHLAAGR